MTVPSGAESVPAAAAPPPWSLMTPDARHRGALADGERAERMRAATGPAHGPQPRADERPQVAQYDQLFGADGLSFDDVLDSLNPLQHIPVVSTLYRELTGDEISTGARLAGGSLYGGPIGLFTAAVDSASTESTGKDVGERALAYLFGEEGGAPAPDSGTAIAAAPPAETRSPAPQPAAQTADQIAAQSAETPAPVQVASAAAASDGATAFFRSLQQRGPVETPAQGIAPERAAAASLQAGTIQAHTSGQAHSTGAAGGITPTGFIRPGSTPSASPIAETPAANRDSETASANGAANGATDGAAQTPKAPRAAASSGPTTLSPAAARVLMQMAESSAGAARPTARPSAPAEPQAEPQAQPIRSPAKRAADPAADPAASGPGLAETVPTAEVPEAMMRALEKYEALKRDG